jgi:hypothetical protein
MLRCGLTGWTHVAHGSSLFLDLLKDLLQSVGLREVPASNRKLRDYAFILSYTIPSRVSGAPYIDFDVWASSEARPLSHASPAISPSKIVSSPKIN